jgi:hypothetical protein
MRQSLTNSINRYIKACKDSNWVQDEAYKFEFANWIYQGVNWEDQTDEEVFHFLKDSQKKNYAGGARGIQFIQKSGREKLSEFLKLSDIGLFRKVRYQNPENINWDTRSMSYTGLSAWLSSLFPEKIYPVPLAGLDQTIFYLFGMANESFPKIGHKYIFACQPFMAETETALRQYLFEDFYLQAWTRGSETNPQLNTRTKDRLTKLDWVWLVQDFHLFVHREILGLYKKKSKEIFVQNDEEPVAIEGNSILAKHMRYERNSAFIQKIKKQAISKNPMLNCEVCGFSFVETYGKYGEGFIEAHHLQPLHENKGIRATRKEHIALVCSNCHRMLHKGNPILSIDELKAILNRE